jgi:hypothetical protein
MANVIPYSFRSELLSGNHNFANGGDTFKLALYTSNPYTVSSTAYSSGSANQVGTSGTGYSTGGNTLGSQAVTISTVTSYVDFADSTWSSATFTAAFGVIYNNSDADKLVVVLDFGGSKTCTNGTFKVTMPDPATPTNAIISMS